MNILYDTNFSLLENFSNTIEKEYSEYVKTHISNVKKGYEYIKKHMPEVMEKLEIPEAEMDKQIEAHDKSKWSSKEFTPYAEHFYGKNKGLDNDPAFEKAWEHHWNNNPHHPEYWGNKSPMPFSCILEMICDWWTFSLKDGNPYEIFDFFDSTKGQELKKYMHPETIKTVEWLLDKLEDSLKKYSNITESQLRELFNQPLNEAFSLQTKDIMDIKKLKEIEALIKKSNKIVLVRHIGPDSDALGSINGLRDALVDRYPKKIIIAADEFTNEYLTPNDVLIVLDLPVHNRIAGNIKGEPKVIRIDHHPSGFEGDVTIEMPSAGSTCELVALFLDFNGYKITKRIGEELFKGIISDTGRLEYSISPTTLAGINIVRNAGVDYEKIYRQMYVKDEISLKSKSFILDNYKTTPNGVAYLYLDYSRVKSAGIDMEKTKEQISEMSRIQGSPIWVILMNRGKGKINMSVRSRIIPIKELCEKFGGGGHNNACGVSVKNTDEAKLVLIALDDLLKAEKEKNPNIK